MGIKNSKLSSFVQVGQGTDGGCLLPDVFATIAVDVTSTLTTIVPSAPAGYQHRIPSYTSTQNFSQPYIFTNLGPDAVDVEFTQNGLPLLIQPVATIDLGSNGAFQFATGTVLPSGLGISARITSGTGPVRAVGNYVREADEGWTIVRATLSSALTTIVPAPPVGYLHQFTGGYAGSINSWVNLDTVDHSVRSYIGSTLIDINAGTTTPIPPGSSYYCFSQNLALVMAVDGPLRMKLTEPVVTTAPQAEFRYRKVLKQF